MYGPVRGAEPMGRMSTLKALLEERLGESVDDWLAWTRGAMTYREMARELSELTGVSISKTTVHAWCHTKEVE